MENKFPESFIREVLDDTDLVDLIGHHVQLKKAGANFVGLCPFHSEKSPSFSVSDSKNFYHCFGCGKHGDAAQFLMDYAGLDFREAVTELAGRLGRALPLDSSPQASPAPALTPMRERLAVAYRFFRQSLKHAEAPKAYLKSRGVVAETLKRFAIGYAPDGWQNLREVFLDQYDRDGLLVEIGLLKEKDGRRYDAFRDRLIFAIKDNRGNIIGFGGRTFTPDAKPKYLNSSESAVFDKSSVLFGVHEARAAIQAVKQVIVVEGYMDVVMLAQHGIENVVATMGTACTPAQIKRLCALADETVFTFDGDAAGFKAARRAMENCLPFAKDGHTFKFCLLDGGMDPDEMVRALGPEAFRERIREAKPLSSFLLTQLAGEFNNLATPEDRARFLTKGMELLGQLPPGGNLYRVMRDELSRAADVGVREVAAIARTSRRPVEASRLGKDDAFWSALLLAITRWPEIAARSVPLLISALDEDDYKSITAETFSSETEASFWKFFLGLPEMPPGAPDVAATGISGATNTNSEMTPEDLASKDLAQNISGLVVKHLARARRSRLSAQYRQGLISEADFINSRQTHATKS